MRRLILSFLLLSAPALSLSNGAFAQGFDTAAPIAFVKDLTTGTVLFQKDPDRPMPPASMGKMMSVYTAFGMIANHKVSLDQKVLVRPETWTKWHSQGSTMFLGVGEQPTVRDLLSGIVTLSGNDACVVLAEGLGGTEANYVGLMNREATRIGLTHSHFANTNGWPDTQEYVTARDLAIVAERTIKDYPALYKQFYSQPTYTWGKTLGAGKDIKQENRNPILGKVQGADGLKTGHTDEAGYGFTGSAVQDGRRVVMVLAGMQSWNERVAQSVAVMDWAFRAFEAVPVARKGAKIGQALVYDGDRRDVGLVAPEDIYVSMPRASRDLVKTRLVYTGPIAAPIKAGQMVAELVISGPGFERRAPVVAAEGVDKAGFLDRIRARFGG